MGPGVSVRQDASRPGGDPPRPRHRPRFPAERPPRPRAAPGEEPARLLRPHRDSGPRDPRHLADRRPPTTGRRSSTRQATRSTTRSPRPTCPMAGQAPGRHGRDRGLGVADAAPPVTEPAWLNRRLDVPRVEKLANEGAAIPLLYFARRYCAKLLYEIEFFQADYLGDDAAARYAEASPTMALKIPPANPESYLADIDGSFSTSRATCARGHSRRSCATPPARASSATSGSRAARPATCCASCGRPG